MKFFLGIALLIGSLPLGAQTLGTFFPIDPQSDLGKRMVLVLDRLGELSGLKFRIITELPRARAKAELVKGTLDCLAGANRTYLGEDLKLVWEVPGALLATKLKVITLGPPPNHLGNDFKAYSLITERDSAGARLLAQAPGYNWIPAASPESALRMLIAHRGDGVLMNEEVFRITREAVADLKGQPWVLHPKTFW